MESIDKCLQSLRRREFALENPVIRQLDPDDGFCVQRLLKQVVILLFPFVHELSLFAIVLHFLLEGLVIYFFVLVHLLLLVELYFHALNVLRLHLEYLDVPVLYWLRHDLLSTFLLLCQHVVEYH